MEPGRAGISNFSPIDGASDEVRGHAVIVGSRRPEAICVVTAKPASVLKMTHARIAALPVEQIEHASELFNLR